MMSFSLRLESQTIHCLAGFTSESVQVLQVTCPHDFITARFLSDVQDMTMNANYARNIKVLFENPFLHEGHMASASSLLFLDVESDDAAGVDSIEAGVDRDVSKVNLTSIRFFRLPSWFERAHTARVKESLQYGMTGIGGST